MAIDSLPSWLSVTPRDFVQAGNEGANTGLGAAHVIQAGNQMRIAEQQHAAQLAQQAALENAHLSQHQHLAEMEMQARKEIAEQNHLREQQQNAQLNAYRQSEVGLRRANLEREQALNDAQAREKAKQYADEQGLANWIAHGGSMASGLAQFPGGRGNAMALKSNTIAKLGAPEITHTEAGDIFNQEGSRVSHFVPKGKERVIQDKNGAINILMPDHTLAPVRVPQTTVDPYLSGGGAAAAPVSKPGILSRLFGGDSAVPIPPPAAAPASTSPFKEGQQIRNKKDGGIYVIQNGVPVPVSKSAPAANVPAVLGDTSHDEEDSMVPE